MLCKDKTGLSNAEWYAFQIGRHGVTVASGQIPSGQYLVVCVPEDKDEITFHRYTSHQFHRSFEVIE